MTRGCLKGMMTRNCPKVVFFNMLEETCSYALQSGHFTSKNITYLLFSLYISAQTTVSLPSFYRVVLIITFAGSLGAAKEISNRDKSMRMVKNKYYSSIFI